MQVLLVSAAVLSLALPGFALGGSLDDAPPTVAALRVAYGGPPATWPEPWLDPGVTFQEMGAPLRAPASPRAAALGALLFREPRLSADGRVACGSCHDPEHGFSVPERVGHGVDGAPGRRNPPGLASVTGRTRLDWDGGGGDLARRVLAPLTEPREMGRPDLEAVLATLSDMGYGGAFTDVFGREGISARTLSAALMAYLATIDDETRFDRFAQGDREALTDLELSGLHLFRTKARCANCHSGPLLTDERFHNLRLSFFGEPAQDLGRHAVTHVPDDAGRFRTPSLRHVAASPPYMHNGLFPTLDGVVNLYDRGGGEVWARNAAEAGRPLFRDAARLSAHIRPLGLTPQEKAALVAFLKTL
ncbi:cytochrome c peroxidase [Xanthobacter autotrophicus DSM 431]|uniref:cytochrome-c peroxidase n=1 Tax=Xanthobacter nonsaccharivorans TaxID=3119912 RepID=UPI00372C5AF3